MPRVRKRSSHFVLGAAVVALSAVPLGHARLAAQQASPSPPSSSPVEARPTPSAAPAHGDEIVAKIGDRVITLREIEDKLRIYPDSVRERVLKANNLRTYVKGLVVKELAAREAERLGIDKAPRVRERLAETRQDVLYNALTTHLLSTLRVTEAEMEAFFEAHKSEFAGKEYKAVRCDVAQRLRDAKARDVYEAFQRDAKARWPVTVDEAALQKVSLTPSTTPGHGDEVAAKIGDRVITLREIEDRLRMVPESARDRLTKGNNLRIYVGGLAIKELATREAERLGIDKAPKVRERLEETRREALYTEINARILSTINVTDADAEAFFEAHKSEFGGKEYKDVKLQVTQRLRDSKTRAAWEAFQRDAETRWPVTVNDAALQHVSIPKGYAAKEVEKAIEEAERQVGPLSEEQKKMMREGTAPVAPVAKPKTAR